MLFNAPGQATLDRQRARRSPTRGAKSARRRSCSCSCRPAAAVTSATVNGQPAAIVSTSEAGVTVRATFDGVAFRQYQPIVEPDRRLHRWIAVRASSRSRDASSISWRRAGRRGRFPWTPDDFRTPWLVPERLLLFVQLAEPDARVGRAADDRRPRRWSCARPTPAVRSAPRTFVGFYADLSLLEPDRRVSLRARAAGAQARPAAGRLLRERRDRIHRPHRRRWPLTAAFGMGARGRQRMTCPSQRSTSV